MPDPKTEEEKAVPKETAAVKEAKEDKKDPMQNFGRAERESRTKYDHEAAEVVATLKTSISDKVAAHAEATANDAANTAADLKENRAGFVDRIA